MSESLNNTNEQNESLKTTNAKKPAKKRKSHFIRILILVFVFCVAVFGTLVISDLFFSSDESTADEPEIVAVTVSGKEIVLNNDSAVTIVELKEYLDKMEEAGDLFTVALINDTENPADHLVYNSIVELLAEYDIICDKMEKPASYDEAFAVISEGSTAE